VFGGYGGDDVAWEWAAAGGGGECLGTLEAFER
jgi:hypothetical protein